MKKILLLIPVVFLCLSVSGNAQPQYFQRIYTTNIPSDLFFSDIAVSGSSEYILAGYGIVGVPHMDAIYLLKVNSFGIPIWYRSIRDSTTPSRVYCMVKKNNKYIVTGYSDSVYTLCVDDNGNTLWHKKYFQASHGLVNITTTSDNGFIACGWKNNQGLIIKTDSVGNLLWTKNFDAGYSRYFNKIIQHNNYFYLIGVRDDVINDIGKPVISRINLNGDSLVEKKFSFPDIRFSFENIIQRNNVFYIFGSKVQGSSRVRNFLLKCDLDFNLKDTITISSPVLSSSDDSFNHVSSYKDKFIMQSNVYPAFISDTIYNQFKLLDSNFNLIRYKDFKSLTTLNQLYTSPDNSIISVGHLKQQEGIVYNGYLNKMDSNFYSGSSIINIQNNNSTINNFTLHQNYPNPFNPSTKISYSLKKSSAIELKLFDINGRLIKIIGSGFKPAGSYEINFSAEGLSSGVYFFSLYSEGILMDTKKAVVVK